MFNLTELKSLSDFIYNYGEFDNIRKSQKSADKIINDVSKLIFDSDKPIPEELKSEYGLKLKRALSICRKLKESGDTKLNESIEKAESSCKTLLQKLEGTQKPPFRFLFGCDLGLKDDENAVAFGVLEAINNDIPVITSAAITSQMAFMALTSSFTNAHFFREVNGNFVLIIPKKNDSEIIDLDALGLKGSKFKKIDNIFEKPIENITSTIDNFIGLFETESPCEKEMALVGHGTTGYIGGMKEKDYSRLLSVLDEPGMKCTYVDITSCHAGGETLLSHYVSTTKAGEKIKPSFHILVRAITSLPTTGKDHIKTIFSNFGAFRNENLDTVETMGLYQQKPFMDEQNYPLVRFPTKGATTPYGYRPIPMKQSTLTTLTYTKMRALELVGEKNITFDTLFVGLYPMVINSPIKIKKVSPILVSLIPGNAHHYLNDLELINCKLTDLIDITSTFFKDISSNKAFFIRKLKEGKTEYDNVLISFIRRKDITIRPYIATILRSYQMSGKTIYERVREGKVEQIDEKEYILEASQTLFLTIPKEEAVWLSSGGQESEQLFLEELNQGFVNENSHPLFKSDFKEDREVLLRAVQMDAQSVMNLPEELKTDKDFIKEAAKKNFEVLRYTLDEFQDVKDVVLAALDHHVRAYLFASEKLKLDKDILFKALKLKINVLEDRPGRFPQEGWKDRDLILEIVKIDGLALQFAPEHIRKDKEIVEQAIRQNPEAKKWGLI